MPKFYEHPGTGEQIELPDNLTDDDAIRAMYNHNSAGFEQFNPDELRKVFARSIEKDNSRAENPITPMEDVPVLGTVGKVITGIQNLEKKYIPGAAPLIGTANDAYYSAIGAVADTAPAVANTAAAFLRNAVKAPERKPGSRFDELFRDTKAPGYAPPTAAELAPGQKAEKEFDTLVAGVQKSADALQAVPDTYRGLVSNEGTPQSGWDFLTPRKLIPTVAGALGTTASIAAQSTLPGVGLGLAATSAFSLEFTQAQKRLKEKFPDMPQEDVDSWATTYAVPAAALEFGGTMVQLGAVTGKKLLASAGYNLSEEAVEKLSKTTVGKLLFAKVSPLRGVAAEVITENLQETLQTGLVEGRLPTIQEFTATSIVAGLSAGTFHYGTHKLLNAPDPISRKKAVDEEIPLVDQFRNKTAISRYIAGEISADQFMAENPSLVASLKSNRVEFDVAGTTPEERSEALRAIDDNLYTALEAIGDKKLKSATGVEAIVLGASTNLEDARNPYNQFLSGKLPLEGLYTEIQRVANTGDYTGFTPQQKFAIQDNVFRGNIFSARENVTMDPTKTLPIDRSAPIFNALRAKEGVTDKIAQMSVQGVQEMLWNIGQASGFDNLGDFVNSPDGRLQFTALTEEAAKRSNPDFDALDPDETFNGWFTFQDQDGNDKSVFDYKPGDHSMVKLVIGNADTTTIFHELSHFMVTRVAPGSSVERDILGFVNSSRTKERKVNNLKNLDSEGHEAVARMTEVYLLNLAEPKHAPEGVEAGSKHLFRVLGEEMKRLYKMSGLFSNNTFDVPDLGTFKNANTFVNSASSLAKGNNYNLRGTLDNIFYGGLKKGSFTIGRAEYTAESVNTPSAPVDLAFEEIDAALSGTPPAAQPENPVLDDQSGVPNPAAANLEPQTGIVGLQSAVPGTPETDANGAENLNAPQPIVDRTTLYPDDPLAKIIAMTDRRGKLPSVAKVMNMLGVDREGAKSALAQAYGDVPIPPDVKVWFPTEGVKNFYELRERLDEIREEGGTEQDIERRQTKFINAVAIELGVEGYRGKKGSAVGRQAERRATIARFLTASRVYKEKMGEYSESNAVADMQGVLHVDAMNPAEFMKGTPVPGRGGRFYQTQRVREKEAHFQKIDDKLLGVLFSPQDIPMARSLFYNLSLDDYTEIEAREVDPGAKTLGQHSYSTDKSWAAKYRTDVAFHEVLHKAFGKNKGYHGQPLLHAINRIAQRAAFGQLDLGFLAYTLEAFNDVSPRPEKALPLIEKLRKFNNTNNAPTILAARKQLIDILSEPDLAFGAVNEMLTYTIEAYAFSSSALNRSTKDTLEKLLGDKEVSAIDAYLSGDVVLPRADKEGRFYQTQKVKNALPETKVVDERGMPRRVYHGTMAVFDRFRKEQFSKGAGGDLWLKGFYFSESAEVSSGYATREKETTFRFKGSPEERQELVDAVLLEHKIEYEEAFKEPQHRESTLRVVEARRQDSLGWDDAELADQVQTWLPYSWRDIKESFEVQQIAPGANIHQVYLDIKNPVDIDALMFEPPPREELVKAALPILREWGKTDKYYQGVIYNGVPSTTLSDSTLMEIIRGNNGVMPSLSPQADLTAELLTKEFGEGNYFSQILKAGGIPTGGDLVRTIRDNIDDDWNQKKLLRELGYDGITHINRNGTGGVRQWIAWEPEQIHNFLQLTHGQKQRVKQTNTPEFKKWFGNSVVVGEDGEPRQMYHGTSKDKDFHKFNVGMRGVWFTPNPSDASGYAETNDSQKVVYENNRYVSKHTSGRVIPAYLRIENPYTLTQEEMEKLKYASNYTAVQRTIFANAKSKGYDGIIWGDSYVVFDKGQIKSSIGNNGAFDSDNPSILGQKQKKPNKQDLYDSISEQLRPKDKAPRTGYEEQMRNMAAPLSMDRATVDILTKKLRESIATNTFLLRPEEWLALQNVYMEQMIRVDQLVKRGGSHSEKELNNFRNELQTLMEKGATFGSDIMRLTQAHMVFPTMVELADAISKKTGFRKIHAQIMANLSVADFNELGYTTSVAKDAEELTKLINENSKLSELQKRILSSIDFESKDVEAVKKGIADGLLFLNRDKMMRELVTAMFMTNVLSSPGTQNNNVRGNLGLHLFGLYVKLPSEAAIDLVHSMLTGKSRSKFVKDSFVSVDPETGAVKPLNPFKGVKQANKTLVDILQGKVDWRAYQKDAHLDLTVGGHVQRVLMEFGSPMQKKLGVSLDLVPRLMVGLDAWQRAITEEVGHTIARTRIAEWQAAGTLEQNVRPMAETYLGPNPDLKPGQTREEVILELMQRPLDLTITMAHEFGNFATLQNKPGNITTKLTNLMNTFDSKVYQDTLTTVADAVAIPGVKQGLHALSWFSPARLMFPFRFVPANAIKFMASTAPVSLGNIATGALMPDPTFGAYGLIAGGLLPAYWDSSSGASKQQVLANFASRQLVAHALYLFLAWAMDNDWWVGGPQSKEEADAWARMDPPKQPYSFKVMWNNEPMYVRIPDPLGMALHPITDAVQAANRIGQAVDKEEEAKILSKAFFNLSFYLQENSYLRQAFNLVNSPDSISISRTMQGFLPYSGLLRSANQTYKTLAENKAPVYDITLLQKQMYENPTKQTGARFVNGVLAEVYGDHFSAFFGEIIPGFEGSIPEKITYFGETKTREEILGMRIPWQWMPESPDLRENRLENEFDAVRWYPGLPQRKFERAGKPALELSDEQYRSYCLKYGELFVERSGVLLNNPYYQRLPRDKKAEQLAKVSGDAREAALSKTKMFYKLR